MTSKEKEEFQKKLINSILEFDPRLEALSLKPLHDSLKSKFPFLEEKDLKETVELIKKRRNEGFGAFNNTADNIQLSIKEKKEQNLIKKIEPAPVPIDMNNLYVTRLLMKKQKDKLLKSVEMTEKRIESLPDDISNDHHFNSNTNQENASPIKQVSIDQSLNSTSNNNTVNSDNNDISENKSDKSEKLLRKTITFSEFKLPSDGKRKRNDENVSELELKEMTEKALKKSRVEGKQCDSPFYVSETPRERYADFGGVAPVLTEVKRLIEYPFRYPDIIKSLGSEPAKGVLLYGPPGCGKTMLSNAIAGELGNGISFFRVSAPEIVSGMSGESEQNIRKLFEDAQNMAPSLIYIDEIDSITPKRENSNRGMEKRIVTQFISCIDSLNFLKTGKLVIILASTNVPDAIDPALRRAGRFEREIILGIPDEDARYEIITRLSKNLKLSGDFDFREIAKLTPGYVGADLHAITKEAATNAISRIYTEIEKKEEELRMNAELSKDEQSKPIVTDITPFSNSSITMEDFLVAIKKVQPSAKREGFATVPDISWDDVGALGEIRYELQRSITDPIDHPKELSILGLKSPCGVLLYGPPGCGKTLVAKAIANQAKSNFISVKGPELLNKFVGESERAVRMVFERARASAPCIIFFDELDSLCPKRGMDKSNASSERVVNQLLTELDGVGERKQVFVIAATNRPDIIDPAMLRPGRLDKLLYVPIPDLNSRTSILKTVTRKMPLSSDVILASIAKKCEHYTGADLTALCRESATICFEEYLNKHRERKEENNDFISTKDLIVRGIHFEKALKNIIPSVSEKDRLKYENLRNSIEKERLKGK